MAELDRPLMLTFNNHRESSALVDALEQAKEQVIWEQRVQEDGTINVTILNVINLEEKEDIGEE